MLNVTEIRHQARAIWLTIGHRFSSEIHDMENCTFAFEIHTRNVAYDKILERQSTEVLQLKVGLLELFFLYRKYLQLILH